VIFTGSNLGGTGKNLKHVLTKEESESLRNLLCDCAGAPPCDDEEHTEDCCYELSVDDLQTSQVWQKHKIANYHLAKHSSGKCRLCILNVEGCPLTLTSLCLALMCKCVLGKGGQVSIDTTITRQLWTQTTGPEAP